MDPRRILRSFVAIIAIVALLPLLVAISLAIKLTSRGPVFFIQQRVGKRGRAISVVKFRTLQNGTGGDGFAELVRCNSDSRVTGVGRTLRALHLDELPQLINVAIGDMTFIGPRPYAFGIVRARQEHGINLTPNIDVGMTSIAALRLREEEDPLLTQQLNRWYENQLTERDRRKRTSFLHLRILWLTVVVLLRRKKLTQDELERWVTIDRWHCSPRGGPIPYNVLK